MAGASSSSGAAAAATDRAGANGRAEGSTNPAAVPGPTERRRDRDSHRERTLDDVMREPSTVLPSVVVLDSVPEPRKEPALDPKEDLWLSTADGRFSSPVIPLRVGSAPYIETFYVHKHILLKSKYFERALCGDFKESGTQSVELPEENPAIFHFLIAYLYEGKYTPIRSIASVLIPDQDKGKGREDGQETNVDSDSEDSVGSFASDNSAVSRRRRDRRRRRDERYWERMRQKRPGAHRPNCNCPQCLSANGPPCWHCQAPRVPPAPAPMPGQPGMIYDHNHHMTRHDRPRRRPQRRHGMAVPPAMTPPPPPPRTGDGSNGPNSNSRISGEDLRTWLLTYELNIDVYILANKFLLEGFKTEIARAAIDMLETAGSDAAVPQVLFLCRKLYEGLPENDNLLKMIFARVGFLQPWRQAPEETQDFLVENPEIAPLLLREMASRREDDVYGRTLPSMERPWIPPTPVLPGDMVAYRAHPYHHYRAPAQRW